MICWLWSKSTIKALELCDAVFIFNFEHIVLLLSLNMYLLVGHKIKSSNQLKSTLNNMGISLKHVYMKWVSQLGLNNL